MPCAVAAVLSKELGPAARLAILLFPAHTPPFPCGVVKQPELDEVFVGVTAAKSEGLNVAGLSCPKRVDCV